MGQEKSRVSAEIPVRWDSKGTSCKERLEVLLLQQQCPAGWMCVHKGSLKASKMVSGAGSSRAASDSQRHHRSVFWKSSGGKVEGRQRSKPREANPWSGTKPGCPGQKQEEQVGEDLCQISCSTDRGYDACPQGKEVRDAWEGT